MATSFNFGEVIKLFKEVGVYEYLLPFLLVFGIVFAILEKTNVFGEDKTNINALISVIIGLVLIVQQGIVETINLFLPRVSLILIVILMFIIVMATLAGKKFEGFKGAWLGLFMLVGLVAVIYAAVAGTGSSSFLSDREIASLLTWGIPTVVIAAAIWWITRAGKPKKESKDNSALKLLKSLGESV